MNNASPYEDPDFPEMEYFEESSDMSSEGQSWISWFCSQSQNSYYCQVPEEFIEDGFNLTGLSAHIPLYKEAFEMILDIERDEEGASKIPDVSILEPYAEMLYGLIHQRYINTAAGLNQMLTKYKSGHFGRCPRVYCRDCQMLPCGQHDIPKQGVVRLYCPSCKDLYTTSSKYNSVDGAHFGTTFPHHFVATYPNVFPQVPTKIYEGRIFGFRVHELSPAGPRMRWLRMSLPPSANPSASR